MSKKLYHFCTALLSFLTNCWHFFNCFEINVRYATIHPKCIKFNDPKILFFWLADPKEQSRKHNSTKHWMSVQNFNLLFLCTFTLCFCFQEAILFILYFTLKPHNKIIQIKIVITNLKTLHLILFQSSGQEDSDLGEIFCCWITS